MNSTVTAVLALIFGSQLAIATDDCVDFSGKWRSEKPWDKSHRGGDPGFDCRDPNPYPELAQKGCKEFNLGPISDFFEIGKTYSDIEKTEKYTKEYVGTSRWEDRNTLSFSLKITGKESGKPDSIWEIRFSYKMIEPGKVEYNREDYFQSVKRCWQKDTYHRNTR